LRCCLLTNRTHAIPCGVANGIWRLLVGAVTACPLADDVQGSPEAQLIFIEHDRERLWIVGISGSDCRIEQTSSKPSCEWASNSPILIPAAARTVIRDDRSSLAGEHYLFFSHDAFTAFASSREHWTLDLFAISKGHFSRHVKQMLVFMLTPRPMMRRDRCTTSRAVGRFLEMG